MYYFVFFFPVMNKEEMENLPEIREEEPTPEIREEEPVPEEEEGITSGEYDEMDNEIFEKPSVTHQSDTTAGFGELIKKKKKRVISQKQRDALAKGRLKSLETRRKKANLKKHFIKKAEEDANKIIKTRGLDKVVEVNVLTEPDKPVKNNCQNKETTEQASFDKFMTNMTKYKTHKIHHKESSQVKRNIVQEKEKEEKNPYDSWFN